MRKFQAYGAAALLALSAVAGGVTYAQSTTATPTAPTTSTQQTAVQRPWLGVAVTDDGTGVTITQVATGSPAETAKLQVGDVITQVNGTTVETASDLQKIIAAAASGDVVTLTIERSSAQSTVEVTLASRTAGGPFGRFSDPLQMAEARLDVQLETATDGYQVTAVNTNAPFALQVGDVVTEVNGTAIASVDWHTLVTPSSTDTSVTLTVERSGASVTVSGQLAMFGGRGGFRGGFPGNGNGQNNPPGGGFGQPNGNNNGQPNGNNGQPGGFLPPGNGQPGSGGITI